MPNTIRTQQDLLNNIFKDGQPPNSITAQDMRDFVVSVPSMATTAPGTQGTTGAQGAGGVQGLQGPSGFGTQGIQGVQGIQGDLGIQGTVGTSVQGIQGTQGIQGNFGVQGIQGLVGPVSSQHGWKFYLDGQYTQVSPRTITAGTKTQVTINGALETTGHPPGLPECWNIATNRLIPPALNGFGIVRFAFTAATTHNSVTKVEFELDAGGAAGVIFRETLVFSRGQSQPQSFNLIMPLFCGADFVANGGILYLTPEHTGDFWEFAVTAVQIYTPA
jgi:hypothetical protein